MNIRKSTPQDAASIAPLLLLAMEDVFYNFIGIADYDEAREFLEELVRQPETQYSYENCRVAEQDGIIAGVACLYDGAHLHKLRKSVATAIKSRFRKEFNPEDETEEGEVYIDCVAVNPDFQGRGIGSLLFNFLIDEYVNKENRTLGLLVDFDNPNAKKLYEKLGFLAVGTKKLTGKYFTHMQIKGVGTAGVV